MKLLITILTILAACSPQKKEAGSYVVVSDASGRVVAVQKMTDTLVIDLDKVRHLMIRGRVYDLPTNQQCQEAEEDSIFLTQLAQQ